MPLRSRAAAAALGLSLVWPAQSLAQGTAPTQGVTQPQAQPVSPGGPPAPDPRDITDGRPRADPGGGAANTAPGTTSSLPLPPQGQADPPPKP